MSASASAVATPKTSAAGSRPKARPKADAGIAQAEAVLSIPIDRIDLDPAHPRKTHDRHELARLGASMKERGQLVPMLVRRSATAGRWVVVSGERRYRAALAAGLPALLCIEDRGADRPDEILTTQLVENCLREDIKPIEQARAFRALLDRTGWSCRQLAKTLHVGPAAVTRSLALLNLPAEIQDRIKSGDMSPSTAYEVTKLSSPADRIAIANEIVAHKMTRAETAAAVQEMPLRDTRVKVTDTSRRKRSPRRTFASIRTPQGVRVTIEYRRGIDDKVIEAALLEALSIVRGRLSAPTN